MQYIDMVSVNIDPWVAGVGLIINALTNLATLVAYDRYVKKNMDKAFEKMEKKIAGLKSELDSIKKE